MRVRIGLSMITMLTVAVAAIEADAFQRMRSLVLPVEQRLDDSKF